MRFQKIETHKPVEKETQTSAEQKTRETESAGRGVGLQVRRDPREAGIPLEWQRLTPFIEAHRARQPSEQYLQGFWGRLLPRLKRTLRQNELVREYLRQTFWPRWIMRAAATALIAAMAFGLLFLREENQSLQRRVAQLEGRVQELLKAGM